MPMHMIAEEGPQKGKTLRFEGKDEFIIGRDPDLSDIILDDPTVSRKHVLCKKQIDGLTIEDLSHTNPILVNDHTLIGEHLLKEGDVVKIGQNIFLYSQEDYPYIEEEEKEKPKEEIGIETIFLEEPEKAIDEKKNKRRKKTKEKKKTPSKKEKTTVYDTIFEDLKEKKEIFPLAEEPKLILKVLSGPNTGGEFALEVNKNYLLGKDPEICDIVFNDLGVSKRHANLTIDQNKTLYIEDLGSKNKTYVNSYPIEEKKIITSQDIITMGTTSFIIIDKEKETETIYIPSPAIVEEKEEEEKKFVWKKEQIIPIKHLVTVGILGFIFLISFVSFFSLFKSHKVQMEVKDFSKEIDKILEKYPSIHFSYNPLSENLFLMGHVLTKVEQQQMLHDLKQLPYIGSIEDTVIIDDLVWKSFNGILSDNPNWRSISIHSPKAGQFIVSGYLETTDQAENLFDYLNMNFPYINLLINQVVIEDVLDAQISSLLIKEGFEGISFGVTNGDVILTGQYDEKLSSKYNTFLDELKKLRGVREITNLAIKATEETARIDLSEKYRISGFAKIDGENFSVVINGQILANNDFIDGLKITAIKQNTILLEKDQLKYKINYSQASQ